MSQSVPPVSLRDARIPIPVLAVYVAWMEFLDIPNDFTEKQWLPVGLVGGILTVANYDETAETPLPPYAHQKVKVSQVDYGKLRDEFLNRFDAAKDYAKENLFIPKDKTTIFPLPKSSIPAQILEFITKFLVVEKRNIGIFETWKATPIVLWGDGFRETAAFLTACHPLIDIRSLNGSMPHEFVTVLSPHHASILNLGADTLVVAFPASANTIILEDQLFNITKKKIHFLLTREEWLKDFSLESGRGNNTSKIKQSHIKSVTIEEYDIEVNVNAALAINTRKANITVESIFHYILATAYNKKSTDIHVEPQVYTSGDGRVRYRLDGDLTNLIEQVYGEEMSKLFRHIKDVCHMTELTQNTQDTSLAVRFVNAGTSRVVKLRVSAMPIKEGRAQAIVLRFLSFMTTSLDSLDISVTDRRVLDWAIKQPHGVIFVTGATGSGKTTTLYSLLGEVNTVDNSILTIEDPIEYEMNGIRQTQVNHALGFSFDTALRSMLRQDPDVILIGETRDAETAHMLLAAAETGHLCLTTLHTNTALGVLPRMESFAMKSGSFDREKILSSTILFQAQRLCRRVCPHCYESNPPTQEETEIMRIAGVPVPKGIAKGRGCSQCLDRGTSGRVAIMELVPVEEGSKIYRAIEAGKSIFQIREIASQEGFKTLFQSALERVATQVIPFSEAMLQNRSFSITNPLI